jgi:serine/threonine protein phosphatase 1
VRYSGIPGIMVTNHDIPESHQTFFTQTQVPYKRLDNKLYIHGGFNRHKDLEEQDSNVFMWDRDLWSQALSYKEMSQPEGMPAPRFKIHEKFDDIFIGHTATSYWNTDQPMHAANIWNIDTGAGWSGRLTIMDVDTKEYWQSDPVRELYPKEIGR